MARRTFDVIDICEIFVHWHAGRSKSELAGSLGLSRNTVRKYVAAAEAAGMVPGGPPVSIVSVQATIGPSGLVYTERVHGRTVSFHPRGVQVPTSCPRGGFPFTGTFTFVDGSSATAQSTVPCPPPAPKPRRRK